MQLVSAKGPGGSTRRWQQARGLVFAAMFATGFAALLYQVIWQRMLGLFSGSDVRSATIIVGAYLAGLGIGSLVGSAIADRITSRRAVWLYGVCNLIIAILALLSRFIFYDTLFLRLGEISFPVLATLGIVFCVLLLPTLLMGLSMPLLSRALVSNLEEAPALIGRLYAVNTFGAGVGALATGWFIAGTLGYEGSLLLGAILSAGAGGIALWLAPAFQQTVHQGAAAVKERFRDVPRAVWLWCGLVFLSGFIAISLEIIVFRALVVVLKSNAYTYGHFLIFVLIGDALGALMGVRAAKRLSQPLDSFLRIQSVVALFALLILPAFALLAQQTVVQMLVTGTNGFIDSTLFSPTYLLLMVLVWVVLPGIALLPSNILLGYYYPIVQKAVQTENGAVGMRVGLMGMANIAGNAAGSLVTGLVLLQTVGTQGALFVLGMIGLAFSVTLVVRTWRTASPVRRLGPLAVTTAIVLFTLALPGPHQLWPRLLGLSSSPSTFVAEDASGVAVLDAHDGRALLYVDGIVQGEIPFLALHTVMGVVPALVHPDPSQALVIGIGSAGTPYGVGVSPVLDRILAVEIVGSELPVLHAYADSGAESPLRSFFEDPRVEIIVGDGRRELALSATPFDIIQADAIYPWRSHAGMLYSREYFEQARTHLAEGGIMAQWAPTPRVQATFLSVFPYVVEAASNVLLGSSSPIPFDQEALLARLTDEDVVAYVSRAGVDANTLRDIIGGHTPRLWTPDSHPMAQREQSDINTDLFPRDEYFLNTPLFR